MLLNNFGEISKNVIENNEKKITGQIAETYLKQFFLKKTKSIIHFSVIKVSKWLNFEGKRYVAKSTNIPYIQNMTCLT